MLLPSPGGAGGNGKVFCAAGRSIGGGTGHAGSNSCGYSRRTKAERKTEKMIDRNQVKAELTMRIRFASGGTTPVSGALMENALELLEEDEKRIQALKDEITKWMAIHKELVRKVSEAKERPDVKFSRWVKPADHGEYVTAGGDPIFCCKNCGGSYHVHGVEHPRKKLICDNCGCINLYPWEKSYDETSSLAQN